MKSRLLAKSSIEHCPHCIGQLKLIAAIEHFAVIQPILTHLGRPRGRHRVRRPCEWMDQSCDVYTNVLTLFGRFRTLGFYGCL